MIKILYVYMCTKSLFTYDIFSKRRRRMCPCLFSSSPHCIFRLCSCGRRYTREVASTRNIGNVYIYRAKKCCLMSDSRQMEMADACGTVFHGQNNKKRSGQVLSSRNILITAACSLTLRPARTTSAFDRKRRFHHI
jgi:hypothetical protein